MDHDNEPAAHIAACTAGAAHRRDHLHPDETDQCHPHAVEVICLGDRGLAVCHDCAADSGFVALRDAERMAAAHRRDTVTGSARLEPRHAA